MQAEDPVCKMTVDTNRAAAHGTVRRQDRLLLFGGLPEDLREDRPASRGIGTSHRGVPARGSTVATDPVCGMFVDEATSSLRLVRENRTYYFCSAGCLRTFASPEAERRELRRRLTVAWPLSVAIVVLTYGVGLPPAIWAAAALAAIVQFYPGAVFYGGARDAVRQRTGNMDLLIAVGTSAAFAYSLAVLVLPGRLPPATVLRCLRAHRHSDPDR